MTRAAAALAASGCALVLVGCGGEDDPPPPRPPVALTVVRPSDTATVQGASVEVRGRVRPSDARVWVLGRRAEVSDGRFAATVPLEEGANVVDVAATAPGHRTAMTALRVSRDARVTVPDLSGTPSAELEAALAPLGLRVETERGGSLLDRLLPGDPVACDQSPAAGEKVRRGETVRVIVARSC